MLQGALPHRVGGCLGVAHARVQDCPSWLQRPHRGVAKPRHVGVNSHRHRSRPQPTWLKSAAPWSDRSRSMARGSRLVWSRVLSASEAVASSPSPSRSSPTTMRGKFVRTSWSAPDSWDLGRALPGVLSLEIGWLLPGRHPSAVLPPQRRADRLRRPGVTEKTLDPVTSAR